MENLLDPIFILDLYHILLDLLAFPLTWLLTPCFAIWASFSIPLFDSPPDFSIFFYVSGLVSVFLFGYVLSPREPKQRFVWAVLIVVLCACILGVRMEEHVEGQIERVKELERQECFEMLKGCAAKLVRVGEELKVCMGGAVLGKLAVAAGTDGVAACDLADWCRNTETGLVAGGV